MQSVILLYTCTVSFGDLVLEKPLPAAMKGLWLKGPLLILQISAQTSHPQRKLPWALQGQVCLPKISFLPLSEVSYNYVCVC